MRQRPNTDLPSQQLLDRAREIDKQRGDDRERGRLISEATRLQCSVALNCTWAHRDMNDAGMWRV